jgi:hypothetical protein
MAVSVAINCQISIDLSKLITRWLDLNDVVSNLPTQLIDCHSEIAIARQTISTMCVAMQVTREIVNDFGLFAAVESSRKRKNSTP